MSMRAKSLGAVGTIVDGRLRDLAEHRRMNYPVFSRDVGISHGWPGGLLFFRDQCPSAFAIPPPT